SDNISPRHLLNIKRLAYEVSPVVSRWDRMENGRTSPQSPRLPVSPERSAPVSGISAEALSRRIDAFLSSRGFRGEAGTERSGAGDGAGSVPSVNPHRSHPV